MNLESMPQPPAGTVTKQLDACILGVGAQVISENYSCRFGEQLDLPVRRRTDS
jgi:hypothetical protein